MRQVVVSQVFAGGGRAVQGLRQVLALRVERRTQTGRSRLVAVQEALVAEVVEVAVTREAGALFAGGATTRALVVTPGGPERGREIILILKNSIFYKKKKVPKNHTE